MEPFASRRPTRAAGRLLLCLWAVFVALTALAWLGGAARSAALIAAPQFDAAPEVAAVYPPPDARDVPLDAAHDGSITVTFTEPVTLTGPALDLICERSQIHSLTISGGETAYTFTSDRPFLPGEFCFPTVRSAFVSDADAHDPPDSPGVDFTWAFRAATEPILINELETITSGGAADFIELYDGGRGDVALDGLTLVLYRGDESSVYLALALDGYRTDGSGYFVIGTAGVGADLQLVDGTLRDGPDAAAVYSAHESDFPRNAPVTTEHLVDAVVYGPAGAELLALLLPDQAALDEGAGGSAEADSLQRCPNGSGPRRATNTYIQNSPTPGGVNNCRIDEPPDDPPTVIEVFPDFGATNVAADVIIEVTFSEPVILGDEPLEVVCSLSGPRSYSIDGGDSTYRFLLFDPLIAGETCINTIFGNQVSDVDEIDPPDNLTQLIPPWQFTVVRPVAEGVIINEIDADTPGIDAAEFIELYDGGDGDTSLYGLALVLFNGADDRSYLAFDLDDLATDGNGYFLLANDGIAGAGASLPGGALQNGPDAAALVIGDAVDFPNGTPVTATVPLDAIVYSRPTQHDPGLQSLLNPGQPQVDENGRGDADNHSNQRCPNGAGGPRNTTGYKQNTPTPGAVNDCITDTPPTLSKMTPARGATGISISTAVTVEFNEPVAVRGQWVTLRCTVSGSHSYRTSGGPTVYTVEPTTPLAYAEQCTVTVVAALVADADADDPPDTMTRNVSWSFTTADPPADFVLINEIDPDTPSTDMAEFIELYDGGAGSTPLDGLALVFFNGSTNLSYRAIDLDGLKTDSRGYFVVGNAAVAPALTFPDGTLQNGPDAVALYAADASQFPTDTPIRVQGIIDAIVYGDAGSVPPELLDLLATGQAAADENGRGAADTHSLQRCPNGAGGQRRTANFLPNRPTPGGASDCVTDDPPLVMEVTPANGATGISIHSALTLNFSEPVVLTAGAIRLTCVIGGERAVIISGSTEMFQLQPSQPLPYNDQCRAHVAATGVSDADAYDPPDHLPADFEWSFTTTGPPVDFVLINEVDADTPGNDTTEFIELYDGGQGHTDLSGLVIVLYNGSDDRSYHAINLSDTQTDDEGYLVIGNNGVPGSSFALPTGILQNGADAVALYAGDAAGFSSGTALHTSGLIDAVVYGTADPPDTGLLVLLMTGEGQVDEAGRGAADLHSSGRCPNGAGGQRRTTAYRPDTPSPGAPNVCTMDEPPSVLAVIPPNETNGVDLDAVLEVSFSEDVIVGEAWYAIACETSGAHTAVVSGGPREFALRPILPFAPNESCGVTLHAAFISDTDNDDPPDRLTADYSWRFQTALPVPSNILINEVDSDTPGSDTAEFIELFDGGSGHTSLTGLVVVFWNGTGDTAYKTIELDGQQTDAGGYFVLGNVGLQGVDLTFANGTLQNGSDAIAIYAGQAADFPTGAHLTTAGLIDAVVYGPTDSPDAELLTLLDPGQSQVDEASRGLGDSHSLQRCPNGAGGQRETIAYQPDAPTPGAINVCTVDAPPTIIEVSPPDVALDIALDSPIVVRFDEDVIPDEEWLIITCESSGDHPTSVAGGPREYTLTPAQSFALNEECLVTVRAANIHDADEDDPPDVMTANYTWRFQTAQPVLTTILINEVDADTPGSDTAEFIELFDGGSGHTSLTGLVVVFWNGSGDIAYRAIELDGQQTDAGGYFVLGNAGLQGVDLTFANGALQNGPDAIAVYAGRAADFPTGTPLTTAGLIDAIVYGSVDSVDTELLILLSSGQPQIDEGSRGVADGHSLQRCPNGAGGQRETAAYQPDTPTPGASNVCTVDVSPTITEVSPPDGAASIAPDSPIVIRFSEDVAPAGEWFNITCESSGNHQATVAGGPREFTLTPAQPFALSEACLVTVQAANVHDTDEDDPPDVMAADYTWRFQTVLPVPSSILINEVDADTPGSDKAEFIELFDGGSGHTSLTGLVVVFWNGNNNLAYRAIELGGYQTDAGGYFVLGNEGLQGVDLTFTNGALQNGPDAIAIYAGQAAGFPTGAPLTTAGLIDAVVYGPADSPDAELLTLLASGQPQIDEGGRSAADSHSLQRCPNGAGGQRETTAYQPDTPTPGSSNVCTADTPPTISEVSPPDGATNIALDSSIGIHFNEDVIPTGEWFTIVCESSKDHPAAVFGGPREFTLIPAQPFASNEACRATVMAINIHDTDENDPPDVMAADYTWRFQTAQPIPTAILINEVDADTPGSDTVEFIELFDGGSGNTDLTGLVVVLWNGESGTAYRTFDLTAYTTGGDGYFVLGNSGLEPHITFGNSSLQNGPDAVALYAGRADDFPAGAPLTTAGLIDAVVYGPADSPDPELLTLLDAGQPQLDENSRGSGEDHALQRCPDGAGGPRKTVAYLADSPTPGAPNQCTIDQAPYIDAVSPAAESHDVAVDAPIVVGFSEDVGVDAGWYEIGCDASGEHSAMVSGGPRTFTLSPDAPFAPDETCVVMFHTAQIRDADSDDPPDNMVADYALSFHTAPAVMPIIAGFTTNGPLWIGATAVFTNTTTGPSSLTYTWNFGDGSPPSTATHPVHVYAAPGVYTVTLTAASGEATAVYRDTIEVRSRAVFLPLAAAPLNSYLVPRISYLPLHAIVPPITHPYRIGGKPRL